MTSRVELVEPWGSFDDYCGDGSCGISNRDDTKFALRYTISVPRDFSGRFDPTACPGSLHVANGNDDDAFINVAADEAKDLSGAVLPGTTKYGIEVYSIEKSARGEEFFIESTCGDIDLANDIVYWGGKIPAESRRKDSGVKPRTTPKRQDPPATNGTAAVVERSSDGTSCRTTGSQSAYGTYKVAKCRMWRRSEGLISRERLAKGSTTVTCQRNLALDNPIYKAGQTNTWWVWAQSDDAVWDWFPETAVAEGVSDQPINGIAYARTTPRPPIHAG